MASSAVGAKLDPEITSALDLIQLLEADKYRTELIKEIVKSLGSEVDTLEGFLERLLNKLDELIPSELLFIGLATEAGGNLKVVIRDQDRHRVGVLKGKEDFPLSDFDIGGEELSLELRSLTGYVAHIRQAVRVEDVNKWKRDTGFYRSTYGPVKSELSVPILFQDRDLLGVISLQSDKPSYYTGEHERLLQWLARLISRSLDSMMNRAGYRKPYLSQLEAVNQELERLCINADLTSAWKYLSEDARDILNPVAARVAAALNSKVCQIWVTARDYKKLVLEGYCGPTPARKSPIRIGTDKLFKQAFDQKCQLRCGPWDGSSPTPMLITPLLARRRVYGLLVVSSPDKLAPAGQSKVETDYTIGDERMLKIFRNMIATHVDLKHLEYERRAASAKRQQDVAGLLDIFGDINSYTVFETSLATVLDHAREKVLSSCRALYCSIYLKDEATGKFVRRASCDLPEGFVNKLTYFPGEGLTGWVASEGRSLNIRGRRDQDLAAISPPVHWEDKVKQLRADLIDRPFIAVPIILHGETIGVIRCLDKDLQKPLFTEADEEMLSLIAAHISTIIAFTKRYDGAIKLVSNIRDVLAVIKDREPDSDPEVLERKLFKRILLAAKNIFDADGATVYRVINGRIGSSPMRVGKLRRRAELGVPSYDLPEIARLLNAKTDVHHLGADQKLVANDDLNSKLERQPAARGRTVDREPSTIGLRIDLGGVPRAMLLLEYSDTPREINADFDNLVRAFRDVVSLCIEVPHLYKDSVEIAESLHNLIIPDLMRDVVGDASFGRGYLAKHNLDQTRKCLTGIESSSQRIVMSLGEVIVRLIANFRGMDSVIPLTRHS